MKNFYWAPALIFLFFTYSLYGQTEANTQSVKFANAIIGRYQPNINKMTGAGWQYTNTIVLAGIEKVFEQVKTTSYQTGYFNYIKAYVDAYVNADGTIPQSKIMASLGLDASHPGLALCFALFHLIAHSFFKFVTQILLEIER
jgi:unsaturated rhamnogalacturonyl hydrolase